MSIANNHGNSRITIISAIRDLLIIMLPGFLSKYLVGKGRFVFLAHPLELADLAKYYRFASRFPKKALKFISRYHCPVIASRVTGFKDSKGKMCDGWIVYCPFTARMLILKRELAIKKLVTAIRFIEKLNVDVVGLGAFVPIVTNNGQYLREKTSLKIVTGASYSAVTGLQNTLFALDKIGINPTHCQTAIVGAAGSVGMIVSQLFAKRFNKIILVDRNREGLERVAHILISINPKIDVLTDTSVYAIKGADAVFVATNTPGAIVREDHLKTGAVVIDGAHPHNVSSKIPARRRDVIVIESGIAEVEGINTNTDFGLRNSNEVYSCLAEVLILLWKPEIFNRFQEETLPYAETLLAYSAEIGIKPARFQNCLGYITEEDFHRVRNVRKRTYNKAAKR